MGTEVSHLCWSKCGDFLHNSDQWPKHQVPLVFRQHEHSEWGELGSFNWPATVRTASIYRGISGNGRGDILSDVTKFDDQSVRTLWVSNWKQNWPRVTPDQPNRHSQNIYYNIRRYRILIQLSPEGEVDGVKIFRDAKYGFEVNTKRCSPNLMGIGVLVFTTNQLDKNE